MTISQIVRRLGAIMFPSLLLTTNVSLVPDSGANYRFIHSGTRWAGGDGSYPVRLPDGSIAWIFGDSLVKDAAGNLQFVHGTIMVESPGGVLRLVSPGPDLLEPQTPGMVVWPAGGFVENSRLQVFGEEIDVSSGGFRSTGRRFLYAFALPGMQRIDPPHEVYSGVVSWGHAVAASGGWVYVYGNREIDGWTNTTYLARFPLGKSHGFWEFWDGSMFQPSLLAAAPLQGPYDTTLVAKIASVIRLPDGRWAAFTIDPFGATVDVRYATYTWGRWSAKQVAYRLPASDAGSAYLPRAIRVGSSRIRLAYSVPAPTSPIGVRFLRT